MPQSSVPPDTCATRLQEHEVRHKCMAGESQIEIEGARDFTFFLKFVCSDCVSNFKALSRCCGGRLSSF